MNAAMTLYAFAGLVGFVVPLVVAYIFARVVAGVAMDVFSELYEDSIGWRSFHPMSVMFASVLAGVLATALGFAAQGLFACSFSSFYYLLTKLS